MSHKSRSAWVLAALLLLLSLAPGCGEKTDDNANSDEDRKDRRGHDDDQPRLETATMTLQVRPNTSGTIDLQNVDAATEAMLREESLAVRSQEVLRVVLDDSKVQSTEWYAQFNGDREAALDALIDNVLTTAPIRYTPRFEVRASTTDGQDALTILRAVRNAYLSAIRNELALSQETRALESTAEQIDEEIADLRAALTQLTQDNNVEELQAQAANSAIRLRELTVQLHELEAEYRSHTQTYTQLVGHQAEGDYEPSDTERQQIESLPAMAALHAQLRQLQVTRESYLQRYGQDHQLVQEINNQIAALIAERDRQYDGNVAALLQSQTAQAQSALQAMRSQLDALNTIQSQTQARHRQLTTELQRDLSVQESISRSMYAAEQNRQELIRRREAALQDRRVDRDAPMRVEVVQDPVLVQGNWLDAFR